MEKRPVNIAAQREKIQNFSMSFVKALSQSGYYASDHPSARKSVEGLYGHFSSLLGDSEELAFFRSEDEQGTDMLIEGISDEIVKMRKIMSAQSADLFIPRLHQYFIRKKLLSFSFKKGIEQKEFEDFITILSLAPDGDAVRHHEEKDEFNRKLVEAGIMNVSLLFEEDVIGKERKLPWRVEMALTRLRRDLRFLPLYRNLSQDEMVAAKRKVFEDILRPLKKPYILKDFLINCDLIKVGSDILQDASLEEIIISQIPDTILNQVIIEILNEWKLVEQKSQKSDQPLFQEILKRIQIIVSVLTETIKNNIEVTDLDTIKLLYQRNIIPFKDLPKELKRAILAQKWVQEFATEGQTWFRQIDQEQNLQNYAHQVKRLTTISPLLIDQKNYEAITQITILLKDQLVKCSDPFGSKSKLLRSSLKEIASDPQITKILKERYLEGEREERIQINGLFTLYKKDSVPLLLEILKESDKKSVRRSVVDLLIEFKNETVPFLKKILKDSRNPWFVVRNALSIMGELGDKRLNTDLIPFLTHPKDRVREETLSSLSKMIGSEGMDYYIQALDDQEASVKIKAITLLSTMKVNEPVVLQFYGAFLSKQSMKVDENHETIQLAILKAIETLQGTLKWKPDETFEGLLFRILEEEGQAGSLKKFFTKKSTRSTQFLSAVRRTLLKIGSEDVRRKLTKMQNP